MRAKKRAVLWDSPKTALFFAILLFAQVQHALPCHYFPHHRIQKSLCPHQGPTHPPRSRTAWRPALPSCGGDCLCPVSAATLPHVAHPFPEYTRHGFFGWNTIVVFFSVREPHRQHKCQGIIRFPSAVVCRAGVYCAMSGVQNYLCHNKKPFCVVW